MRSSPSVVIWFSTKGRYMIRRSARLSNVRKGSGTRHAINLFLLLVASMIWAGQRCELFLPAYYRTSTRGTTWKMIAAWVVSSVHSYGTVITTAGALGDGNSDKRLTGFG